MKKSLLLLLPLLLAVAACRHEGLPQDVLEPDRMADFLADAYLVEGSYAVESQYRYDSLTDRVVRSYDSILDLHGITRDQVDASLDYYANHLDLYQAIQDSVVIRLEARQQKANERRKTPAGK